MFQMEERENVPITALLHGASPAANVVIGAATHVAITVYGHLEHSKNGSSKIIPIALLFNLEVPIIQFFSPTLR